VCDQHERCSVWKEEGECIASLAYMKRVCPASCHGVWSGGSTSETKHKMKKTDKTEVENEIKKENHRQQQERLVSSSSSSSSSKCQDQHERCALWARVGECRDNPDNMKKYCPESCGYCGPEGGFVDRDDDFEEDEYEGPVDDDEAVHFDEEDGVDHDHHLDDDDDDDEGFVVEVDPECTDKEETCTYWASIGECKANSDYMHLYCPVSCDACDRYSSQHRKAAEMIDRDKRGQQQDQNQRNRKMARGGGGGSTTTATTTAAGVPRNTLTASDHRLLQRTEDFGIRQVAEGAQLFRTMEVVRQSVTYMNSEETRALPESVLKVCENRHEYCAFWAHLGECEKNRAYMVTNCAPSCGTCHLIDMENRCPKLVNPHPALGKGGINRMFESIVRDAPGNLTKDQLTPDLRRKLQEINVTEYSVVVHSRPTTAAGTGSGGADDLTAATDRSRPPWVVTLEDFLTPEECDALIQLGHKHLYKRSEDVGERKFDGTHGSVQSERRTSENAWCSDREGCRSQDVVVKVFSRIEAVIGIPANHSEDLQLLKYEPGQYYRTHHDYIPHQVDRQCGPRILTFFLYLSDVEEGGGTNFPQLDLTIMPKKGRALLWPSVLNSSPSLKDGRMMHQALEVVKGTKYAANAWVHLYDYVTPQANGCN
jgi:prolyl 4-hydroxylase